MNIASVWAQVNDRIADDLPGTVVGYVTTPPCLMNLDTQTCELRIARGDVRPAAAPDAKRNDRRVLQKKEKIRDTTGAALLDKRLLDVERFSVRNNSEAPDFQRARLRRRLRRASASSRWRQSTPAAASRRP
jgi:hypothetical protein